MSIKNVATTIMSNEKKAIIGLAASFAIWWYFIGRKKYGAKGARIYG